MQQFGKLVAAIGAIGFFMAAVLMPTSIDGVVNLALQQRQTLAAAASLALLISGAVLTAGGAIVAALPPVIPPDPEQLARAGITMQGKDYVFGGAVYGAAAKALEAANRAAGKAVPPA